MQFHPTTLPGVWMIELEPREDERGFLARTYCEEEFGNRGLGVHWPQCNLTLTKRRGMVRGLHYQAAPKSEAKLIRCVAGAVWDVVVDLRRSSRTFGAWWGVELSAENHLMLWVPKGLAHGILVTSDQVDFLYKCTDTYSPAHEKTLAWDDPSLGIKWPLPAGAQPKLSAKDAKGASFKDIEKFA